MPIILSIIGMEHNASIIRVIFLTFELSLYANN